MVKTLSFQNEKLMASASALPMDLAWSAGRMPTPREASAFLFPLITAHSALLHLLFLPIRPIYPIRQIRGAFLFASSSMSSVLPFEVRIFEPRISRMARMKDRVLVSWAKK